MTEIKNRIMASPNNVALDIDIEALDKQGGIGSKLCQDIDTDEIYKEYDLDVMNANEKRINKEIREDPIIRFYGSLLALDIYCNSIKEKVKNYFRK